MRTFRQTPAAAEPGRNVARCRDVEPAGNGRTNEEFVKQVKLRLRRCVPQVSAQIERRNRRVSGTHVLRRARHAVLPARLSYRPLQTQDLVSVISTPRVYVARFPIRSVEYSRDRRLNSDRNGINAEWTVPRSFRRQCLEYELDTCSPKKYQWFDVPEY